jgi:hypothetical protein
VRDYIKNGDIDDAERTMERIIDEIERADISEEEREYLEKIRNKMNKWLRRYRKVKR